MDYDDGGPAFPPGESGPMGMSLRDWFAGQALAALGDESLDILTMFELAIERGTGDE